MIELLAAMTLFGLVMAALAAGLHFGLRGWSAQDARIARHAETDAVQRMLRLLLGEGRAFNGRRDRLSFQGTLPEALGLPGLYDISLLLREDKLVLVWRRHLRRPEPGKPANEGTVDLLGHVLALDLAYAGKTEAGAYWGNSAEGGRPLLIRLRLAFPEGDGRRWPDLIVAPHIEAGEASGKAIR